MSENELLPASMFCPVVLLVEDDLSCRRYLREHFHNETSVGILLASNLRTGLQLARDIKVDALVSDLFFEAGSDFAESEIYDGVDLAEAVLEYRPGLPTYFLSFFAGDQSLVDKAKKKHISAMGWLQKSFDPGNTTSEKSPWRTVERDLLRRRFHDTESSPDDNVVNLSLQLRRPIRTFIQELPDLSLTLSHPVEAICTLDEGLARASAPALGLLEDGYGSTVQESLDELAKIIQDQYRWLTGENTAGYAAAVREILEKTVRTN